MSQAVLDFERRDFFPLPHWGWIDVKHFALRPADAAPEDALAALVAHVRYRDNYATATSQDEDSVELHGPYWLRCLSVESYRHVSVDEGRVAITRFAALYCDEIERKAQYGIVDESVLPIFAGATECLMLRQLGEDAIHEWGWVLDDFTEIVVLDRDQGRLTLIVAAED